MHRFSRFPPLIRLLLLLPGLAGTACETQPADGALAAGDAPLESASEPPRCVTGGRVSGSLFGTLSGDIDWRESALSCEGMPRPNGEGARLRFAGPHPSGSGSLVIITAIPALEPASATGELAVGLTLIEETRGRFFASGDFDDCWIDRLSTDELDASRQRLSARVSCISPLGEVNGDGSISIRDLRFTGVVDWSAS